MVAHPRVLTQRTPVLRGGSGYLFFAPFLAPPFFAPPFFLAPPFFAVAILCFSFLLDLPRIQDAVALLLLCTREKAIQHIVVYIFISVFCQLFFSRRTKPKPQTIGKTLKPAPRASFKAPGRALSCSSKLAATARAAFETACVWSYCADVSGSQSHLQGSRLETGSGSQFQGIVTKPAAGAGFEIDANCSLVQLTEIDGAG